MKTSIIFAFALASVSAFHLEPPGQQQRSVEMPVQDIEGRITNRNNASAGQFKYQVGIQPRVGLSLVPWCSGSLIANKWVLTSASCINDASSVIVYLGETTRAAAEITYIARGKEIIIHERYDFKTGNNDIALINIPAVTYSDRIQPVRLPNYAHDSYAGDYAFSSGWGRLSDSRREVSENLKWSLLEVVSAYQCRQVFGETMASALSTICVATPAEDSSCQGDYGSPLVLDSSSALQIGIVSHMAAKGCETRSPVLYTRVPYYLTWLSFKTNFDV